MYYEEKQIDGVWYWRGAPDDDWTPFNATKLYQKLAQKDARIAELEKALRNLKSVAHREVSPKYSAELDEAFTLADIVLGEIPD